MKKIVAFLFTTTLALSLIADAGSIVVVKKKAAGGTGQFTIGSGTIDAEMVESVMQDKAHTSFYDTPADLVSVNKMTFQAHIYTGYAQNYKAVIWDYSTGAVIGVSNASSALSETMGAVECTFASPVTLSASTTYRWGFITNNDYGSLGRVTGGATAQFAIDETQSYTTPQTYSTDSSSDPLIIQIVVDYNK